MNVADVAKYQKWLLLAVLGQVLILGVRIWVNFAAQDISSEREAIALGGTALLVLVVSLAAGIFGVVALILMMGALERPLVSKILAGISQFIPLVGLVVLLVVNQRATRTLRAGGYAVGLMGAKKS